MVKSVTIRLATGFFLATGLAYIKKKKIYRRKNNSEFNTKKWTSKMYLLPFKIYNDISLQISIFCSHIKYASNESNGYQMCIYFHETPMLQLNRIYNWASSYSEYGSQKLHFCLFGILCPWYDEFLPGQFPPSLTRTEKFSIAYSILACSWL